MGKWGWAETRSPPSPVDGREWRRGFSRWKRTHIIYWFQYHRIFWLDDEVQYIMGLIRWRVPVINRRSGIAHPLSRLLDRDNRLNVFPTEFQTYHIQSGQQQVIMESSADESDTSKFVACRSNQWVSSHAVITDRLDRVSSRYRVGWKRVGPSGWKR